MSVDDDIEPPNKWSKDVLINSEDIYNLVKEFVDTNIDISSISSIYKEYFCLNYRKMKTKHITGIKCEDKKPIVEEQIYEELIIKLSYFIYYYIQIKNKDTAKIIINHYVLKFLNSDRAYVYNLEIVLKKKKYSEKELLIYRNFQNTNESTEFKVLQYLYQFKYKDKQFSTCGETTLLNILNYCLIKKDGLFDTSKILNNDVVMFYKGKYMYHMFDRLTMIEWLDIVSNLDVSVYNTSGDIHNNVKNVACVLNILVYNNKSCAIDNPSEFIVDTIKYISNDDKDIYIEKSDKESLYLNINNYSLFFRPGHGEMNNKVKNAKMQNFINYVDLERLKETDDDFSIMYYIYKNLLVLDFGEKLDYDQAVSKTIMEYFIFEIKNDIIKIFLSNIIKFTTYSSNSILPEDDDNINNFIYNIRNVKEFSLHMEESKYDDLSKTFPYYIHYIGKYCKGLTSIDIDIEDNEFIYDVNLLPLTKLENLSEISLPGNIENINLKNLFMGIKNKEKIKSIRLSLTDFEEGYDFIKEFINLEDFSCHGIPDLKPLQNLTKLKKLFFRPVIFDTSLIKNLTLLEKINTYDSKIINSQFFSNLVNLRQVYFSYCDFSSTSLEPIVNLNLDNLGLYKTSTLNFDEIITIYNKNIKPEIIEKLDELGIKYVLSDLKRKRSSSFSSRTKKKIKKSKSSSSKSSKSSPPKSSSKSSKTSKKSSPKSSKTSKKSHEKKSPKTSKRSSPK